MHTSKSANQVFDAKLFSKAVVGIVGSVHSHSKIIFRNHRLYTCIHTYKNYAVVAIVRCFILQHVNQVAPN